MSYEAKKGMYRVKGSDGGYVNRFETTPTPPPPGKGKDWFRVEILRKLVDGNGETIAKEKLVTEVYSYGAEAAGLAFRQLPSSLPVGVGNLETKAWVKKTSGTDHPFGT